MVGGSKHHSLHANPRQYPQKEQPVLRSRAVYLRTRKQSLHLSCRPATQLWWSGPSEPCLQLHRNAQTLWPVLAKRAMHQCCFPEPYHPPTRTGSATRTRVSQQAGVRPSTTSKKESGSTVCRTEESDWIAPLAPAQIEVRAGAVLPSGGCTEHQAPGALPQPTDTICSASHHIAEGKKIRRSGNLSQKRCLTLTLFFNTHASSHHQGTMTLTAAVLLLS